MNPYSRVQTLYMTQIPTIEVCAMQWSREPFLSITLAQQRELPSFPAWGGIYAVLQRGETWRLKAVPGGGGWEQDWCWGWVKECLWEEEIHIFCDALHSCVPIACKVWVPSALPQCSLGSEAHQEGKEMKEVMEQWEDAWPLAWSSGLF